MWYVPTNHIVGMGRNFECQKCSREGFKRLSTHWAGPKCNFPVLQQHLSETLEGLVLAGAKIGGNSGNKHLATGSVYEEFITWIADNLDWLAHSIRRRSYTGDRNEQYYVRTHAHPTITRYTEWVASGARKPPETLELSKRTARTWYASAGGLEWHGSDNNQRSVAFSSLRKARATWILQILENTGFDAKRVGKRVQLRPRETQRWLDWIGEPVPGVAHKWAATKSEYDRILSGTV